MILKTATPQQLVALIVTLLLLPRPIAPAQEGASPQPPLQFPQSVYPAEPAPPADSAIPPALTAVTPSTAATGQTVLVTITGASTHFIQGSTTVSLGQGITTTQPTVINAAAASVRVTVAPNAIAGPRTLTVTTGSEILTAPFQITAATGPPAQVAFSPIRVHCGGGIYLDPNGQTWASDTGFLGGNPFSVSSNIAATATPYLYQSERWNSGPVQYVFAVPPASYNVRLKFAEIYFNQAGKRKFDINLNGTVVLPGFDILAAAGASNTAIDRVFTVDASGGQISILLVPVLSNPKISAIEILPQAVDLSVSPSVAYLTPGQTQQFSALVAGTQNQNVNWTLNGPGTLSASGLYTAPASITTRQSATATATSQADGTKLASATVSLSPAWQTATIGTPPSQGTYTYANGAQSVAGTGDLWGTGDYFTYEYQGLNGDGSITARYTSQDPCCLTTFSKAGLMIRGSTSTGSAHAFVSILGAIVSLLETRAADGADTSATFGSAGVFWLKLTRVGNTFTAYVSSEGNSWIPVGAPATIPMPSSVLIGFFSAGGWKNDSVNPGLAGPHNAIFDNLSITSATTVSVDQTLVSLAPGQQAQFSATVLNNANNAVTWSINPANQGSISPTGLYAAPASLVGTSTVTVTATSQADPTKSSSAVVSLGAFVPIRVNAGGPSHIDPNFTFWSSDAGANAGSTYSNGSPIANTTTPYLYQSEHFATTPFQYSYYVPNGNYNVKLKFAEIFFTASGKRTFHVAINGAQVLTNFDVFQDAGAAFTATDKTFPVTVTNGQINIAFTPVISAPKINAIEITQQTIFSVTDFTPKSGPAGTLVTVTGSNLTAGNAGPQVDLVKQGGGTLSAPVANSTATQFQFTVPPGAQTGLFNVTLSGQTVQTTQPFTVTPSSNFTLNASPATANLIQGQSVSYAVSLSSANNFTQLATLSATGVPAGITATFNPPSITAGQTSILTLTAPAVQPTGNVPITISAAAVVDGLNVSAASQNQLNVQAPTTSFLARTVVADALETPLAGVTARFMGKNGSGGTTTCTGQAVSDAAGNLAMTNLPSGCVGAQLISFDGLTVTSPPGKYAGVNLVYTFNPGQVTTSPVLVHLPRIDNQETFYVQQNAAVDQSYAWKSVPGLAVTVYKGTTFFMADGSTPNPFPLVGVQVPVDRLPDQKTPVPTMVSAFIVAFQPANAHTNQPVAVYYPNTLSTAPGTNMTMMTLDPTRGQMVPYGTGTVSPDGSQIIPDLDPAHPGMRYGIINFDWHGPMPPPPPSTNPKLVDTVLNPGCSSGGGSGGGSACTLGTQPTGGEPVDIATNLYVESTTDLAISGGRGAIAIQRVFRSGSANPGPFGIGSGFNYNYQLDKGIAAGSSGFINLVTPDGGFFLFSRGGDLLLRNYSSPAFSGAVMDTRGMVITLRYRDGRRLVFTPNGSSISYLSAIIDPNGNQVTITRGTGQFVNQITAISDPVGRQITFNWDSLNRVTSIADPTGRTVSYTYNAAGYLATVTDPAGGVTRYTYDTNNCLAQKTDARGVVLFTNDGCLVTRQVQADGGVIRFDPVQEQINKTIRVGTNVTDPVGNQTFYRTAADGYVGGVRDALGQYTDFVRGPGNLLLAAKGNAYCPICGPAGAGDVSFTYDANGNVLTRTDALGNTTTFTYEPVFNKLATITDALGAVTKLTYDIRGNLVTATDPNQNTTTFAYDSNGLLVSATDALGQQTTFAYDILGNLSTVTDALGNATRFRYDPLSRLTKQINALGQTSTIAYDKLDRVIAVTDPLGAVTSFTYDPVGNLLSITDPRNNVTSFTYDNMNRLVKRTDALGRFDTRSYDLNGNLISFTDRRGQTSRFTYDKLNRLVGESYNDASVTRVYDSRSRLVGVVDTQGGSFTYQHDAAGRLTGSSGPTGSIAYTRDQLGRMSSRQLQGFPTVNYAYDPVGNLLSATTSFASISFLYNSRNNPITVMRSNGVTSMLSYDNRGRLTALAHSRLGALLSAQSYVYSGAGQRLALTTTDGQSLTTQPAASSVDLGDRLLTRGTITYSHDNAGNRVSENGLAGSVTYSWDGRGRLQSFVDSSGKAVSLQYDASGNLQSQTTASGGTSSTTSFLSDSFRNTVLQYSPGGNSVFLTGPGIDLNYAMFGLSSGVRFPLSDAIGSVTASTDGNGVIDGRYSFEPFGETTISGNKYPFEFTGRNRISDNLYYSRARIYDSRAGRFLSEDPIGFLGGSTNLYRYVSNHPADSADSMGLAEEESFNDYVRRKDHSGNWINVTTEVGASSPRFGSGYQIGTKYSESGRLSGSVLVPIEGPLGLKLSTSGDVGLQCGVGEVGNVEIGTSGLKGTLNWGTGRAGVVVTPGPRIGDEIKNGLEWMTRGIEQMMWDPYQRPTYYHYY